MDGATAAWIGFASALVFLLGGMLGFAVGRDFQHAIDSAELAARMLEEEAEEEEDEDEWSEETY